jgi:cytochrome P450
VCGTPVPADGIVAVLPYLIHRSTRPSGRTGRLRPGPLPVTGTRRHRYAWIPFGGGKRGCIGAGFARHEAVLVLARLCRHHQPPRLTAGSSRLTVPWQLLTLRAAYQQREFAPPYHQEDMDLGETWL